MMLPEPWLLWLLSDCCLLLLLLLMIAYCYDWGAGPAISISFSCFWLAVCTFYRYLANAEAGSEPCFPPAGVI